MSTSITYAGGEITPEVVDGFSSTRPVTSKVHTIMGRPDPDITYGPVGLRKGTFTLIFATGVAARAAETELAVPGRRFTLTDPDVLEVSMVFVVAGGELTASLDPTTRRVWIVGVPYQEVAT